MPVTCLATLAIGGQNTELADKEVPILELVASEIILLNKNYPCLFIVTYHMSERKIQNHPPGALKSPKNPAIPDNIYDIILDPDLPQASAPMDIPKKNPLAQSSVFANLLTSGACRQDANRSQWKYY
jgi:hypothetical protein